MLPSFTYRTLCLVSGMLLLNIVWAEDRTDEDELEMAFGSREAITLATGRSQKISQAPAAVSVIKTEDIKEMGAVDLDQALRSIPGLHVSTTSAFGYPVYAFRGIFTRANPEALVLVNGIPITNVYAGNRGLVWGGMPLENVSRIEVVRGPGSALYGADAFSGVINVVTKQASEIKGTEVGVRVGHPNQTDAWIQHGGHWGSVETAFYLGLGKYGGSGQIIDKDKQTLLDQKNGTHLSSAPGEISDWHKSIDLRTDFAYEKWRLRLGYQHRETGVGVGLADNLDTASRPAEGRLYTDLTYDNEKFAPNWELSSVMGYYDIKREASDPAYTLYPAGAFGGKFPVGMLGDPSHSERHTHASITGVYKGFDSHLVRLGAGAQLEDLYQTREIKNFTQIPSLQALSTGLTDVSGDSSMVFLMPHKRYINYFLVQDEWSFIRDWTFTTGIRRDNYSDFGGTTNPRLALVWAAGYNLTLKAMHGEAFRAPAFSEQYNINNPTSLGNSNLRPEKIKSNELAVVWQPWLSVQTNLSLFDYRMTDIIQYVQNAGASTYTAQNQGSQKGRGFEFETSWMAHRNLKFTGHYSLQHSKDEATGLDAGLAPHRRYFARADWRFDPKWQFGTTINRVEDRMRQPGDSRPQIPNYTTFDFSLRGENIVAGWDIRASMLNALNADAREPSLAPGSIPNDIPLPGRTFYVQFQHKI
jgi:outer membrane receptor for ferrienterochelin and colicins